MWCSHDIGGYAEYTIDDLAEVYGFTVDKSEYPDFAGWLWDMERSGVITNEGGRRMALSEWEEMVA